MQSSYRVRLLRLAVSYIVTSNGGQLLLLSDHPPTTYLHQRCLRAGIFSTWGRAEVLTASPDAAAPQLLVRSGNVENPHNSLGNLWSDWKPLPAEPQRYPPLRHATFSGRRPSSLALSLRSVTLNTAEEPSPQVDEIVVQAGRASLPSPFRQLPPFSCIRCLPCCDAPASIVNFQAIPIQLHSPHNAIGDRNHVRLAGADETAMTSSSPSFYRDVHEHNWHLLKGQDHRPLLLPSTLPFCPMRSTSFSRPRQRRSVTTDADTLTGERISATPFLGRHDTTWSPEYS